MRPHDLCKWGIQIVGPDDIIAAKDFDDAYQKSKEITEAHLGHRPDDMVGLYPVIYAYPIIWDEERLGIHAYDEKSWQESLYF